MTRFVVAAVLTVGLWAGTPGKADAQIVYGYSVPANGGIMSGGTVYGPGAAKTFQNYYSPFTGAVQRQSYYSDVFGNSYGRSYGYNPMTGMGYRTGFYNPGYNTWGGYGNYGSIFPGPENPGTELGGYLQYRNGFPRW